MNNINKADQVYSPCRRPRRSSLFPQNPLWTIRRPGCLVPILILILWSAATAEDIVFPRDAGIINVKLPPFNAAGNGITDDTRALNRALDSFPSGNKIIYMPNGTYLISDTLSWPAGNPGATDFKRTILQGQSQAATVVKLADNAPLYSDSANPRPMIYTGPRPAQRFRNGIRNLTVDAGNGNPGAIGIQFHANNQGCLRNTTIRSGNGSGKYGLDVGFTAEIGPCLVKNLTVTGFDIGIRAKYQMNSIAFEHVVLSGQRHYGILNEGQVLSIRDLRSNNSVTAVYNAGRMGHVTLIEATLTGNGPASGLPAMVNDWVLFCRDATTPGYGRAVVNNGGHGRGVDGSTVTEFVSHEPTTLFPTAATTPRLPIEETPEVSWGDTASWTSPLRFGADKTGGADATQAIQRAIDSATSTVYFPNGAYRIDGTIHIRGAVQRLIGCEARLSGDGIIRFGDGTAPAVIIERFDTPSGSRLSIEHASARTLVLSSSTLGRCTVTGTGKLFIEDLVSGPIRISGQKVWARQLNVESDTPSIAIGLDTAKVANDHGDLWILNYKTEKSWTTVATRNGGRTEVLGGLLYPSSKVVPPEQPAFLNDNSTVAVTISECLYKGWYTTVVREIRGGQSVLLPDTLLPRRMTGADVPYWQSKTDSIPIVRAFSLPLYVGGSQSGTVQQPFAAGQRGSFNRYPRRLVAVGSAGWVLPRDAVAAEVYTVRGERILSLPPAGRVPARSAFTSKLRNGIFLLRVRHGTD